MLDFSTGHKKTVCAFFSALFAVVMALGMYGCSSSATSATIPDTSGAGNRTAAIPYSQPAAPYESSASDDAAENTGSDALGLSNNHLTSQQILESVPEYSGDAYVELNGNIPQFSEQDFQSPIATETYGELDSLGRCTFAFAVVGKETQPTQKRGNISNIKPSGWHQSMDVRAIGLDHLYERSHLIAHMLTAEDANARNLITGTHYLNQGAMSQFETEVANYINGEGGHVLMRVTPIFQGDELVARGVQMEAYSLEDEGKSVCFNVFCYNVQPGVAIDYATGYSELE